MSTAREESHHLADLLRREHHAMAEFLVALAAFDAERRWVELGHRSLFHFLVRELGLPKGPAYYRKTAAELIQRYPEIVEPLRDGRLHLTSLVEVSKVITPENRAEVLPRFFHASKREAKEVSAAILPAAAPPLRTVVTAVRSPAPLLITAAPAPPDRPALPEGVPPSPCVSSAVVLPEEPAACQSAVPGGARLTTQRRTERTEIEPLTADLRRIHLTVSRRLLEKLARARDALSHSHPGASEETVLEVGLDLILDRFAKRRGIGAKPRNRASGPTATPGATSTGMRAAAASEATSTSRLASTPEPPANEQARPPASASPPTPRPPHRGRSRHVPAAVWRAVWERDGGCCSWPLDGGGVCGSTTRVQLDHVRGFALGAETTVEGCRLLCAFHQDVHARALYGDDLMNLFTRPTRGSRCSEPVATYGSGDAPASRWSGSSR